VTEFVATRNGLLNLSFVARVTNRKTEGSWETVFLNSEGETLGAASGFDADGLVGTVIPAAPGSTAALIWVDEDSKDRPSVDDVYSEIVPVIAWRVDSDGTATPVFLEQPVHNARILFPMPDGHSLLEPDVDTHQSLDGAKAETLKALLSAWERKQADKKQDE
jgi:hypothetical protein